MMLNEFSFRNNVMFDFNIDDFWDFVVIVVSSIQILKVIMYGCMVILKCEDVYVINRLI